MMDKSQNTKWPKPRRLSEVTSSDGRYVWVWSDKLGWSMYVYQDSVLMVADKSRMAIPVSTPEAIND